MAPDAPSFRVWPPVALGVPLILGAILTKWFGDPGDLGWTWPGWTWLGWALVALFAGWNGWALITMGAARTAVLPGGATTTLLARGPFRYSRNPLYVGLLILDVGLAMLSHSFWALLLVPVGFAVLWWGAVAPEERYLEEKFGADYVEYRRHVRRWL